MFFSKPVVLSHKTSPQNETRKHKIGSHPTWFMTSGKMDGLEPLKNPNWKETSSEPNFPTFRLQPVHFFQGLLGWILWGPRSRNRPQIPTGLAPGSWNHGTCWRYGWSCSPWEVDFFWKHRKGHWMSRKLEVDGSMFRISEEQKPEDTPI